MSNRLSRRQFLKGTAATAVGAAILGTTGLAALTEESGIYTPGTYSATATGMGTVIVTVTFDANSITNIELDVSEETPEIGQIAKDELVS